VTWWLREPTDRLRTVCQGTEIQAHDLTNIPSNRRRRLSLSAPLQAFRHAKRILHPNIRLLDLLDRLHLPAVGHLLHPLGGVLRALRRLLGLFGGLLGRQSHCRSLVGLGFTGGHLLEGLGYPPILLGGQPRPSKARPIRPTRQQTPPPPPGAPRARRATPTPNRTPPAANRPGHCVPPTPDRASPAPAAVQDSAPARLPRPTRSSGPSPS